MCDNMCFIELLAANMFLYTKAHVLYGDYAHDIWDPAMITELLAQLIPVNMRADLLLHRFDKTSSGNDNNPLSCSYVGFQSQLHRHPS